MKQRFLAILALLLAVVQGAWAQEMTLSAMLATLEADSCCITDIGVVVSDVELFVKTDYLTQKTDTTVVVNTPEIAWQSEGYDMNDLEATATLRKARRAANRAPTSDVVHQHGNLMEYFQNFYYYVFSFNYPSVDAEGKAITLSAMAACPTPSDASQVHNVIIGTHITITANRERPSTHFSNFGQDDWGMLFSLAAGPKMVFTRDYTLYLGAGSYSWILGGLGALACCVVPVVGWMAAGAIFTASVAASIGSFVFLCDQLDKAYAYQGYNNDLVIMPDYEGYGATAGRAHPYLYQELTARQCVDAALYGIKIYKTDDKLKFIRVSFRDNFRTMSCGYSQGGSVALAVHRFVEQNNLDKTLHFSGSYCGDGPYDPMSTLMYYMQQDQAGTPMSKSVVLPLIVKGMLDTNPYMVSHKAEEYFRPEFLETGIMDWLASKEYSTTDIDNMWAAYARTHPGAINYESTLVRNIMNDECYAYFTKLYNANKNTFTQAAGIPLPQQRGVMEDLHLALASNDLTSGWKPRHTAYLFHSEGDKVVPYVNAEKAQNTLGDMVSLETAPNGNDHGDSGVDFFKGDSNIEDIVLKRTVNLRLYDYVSKITDKSY